jgi:hypothetical protein
LCESKPTIIIQPNSERQTIQQIKQQTDALASTAGVALTAPVQARFFNFWSFL